MMLNIPMLSQHADNLKINLFTQSTSGKAATPAKLYKLVMDKMFTGVCIFVFTKKDGTYRSAIGTLSSVILPLHDQANAAKYKEPAPDKPNQAFYDLETQSFKSFDKQSVVAIIML